MIYAGMNGTIYNTIDPPIGKGGEGSVYKIQGNNQLVIKVYAPNNRTETRRRKLLAMIKSRIPANTSQQVTWPVDIVFENGSFVGYVMPALSNTENLNTIYSDKYKNLTLLDRIVIAMNLCSSIYAVHSVGQKIGDLNPNNICVNPRKGTVTLVDTDSYHITDPVTSTVYRCEVGRPEYLPAEVQNHMRNGSNLRTAPPDTINEYSDRFALAVHIFALLMNGCHPFACAVNNKANIQHLSFSVQSVTAPQPIDNICNGFSPFFMNKPNYTTPVYAPDFDYLPADIRALFIRAFVDGHNYPSKRPDETEWHDALEKMSRQKFSSCSCSHLFPSYLRSCPWCDINNRIQPRPTSPMSYPVYRPSSAVQSAAAIQQKTYQPACNYGRTYVHNGAKSRKRLGIFLIMIAVLLSLFPILMEMTDPWGKEDTAYATYYDDQPKMVEFDQEEYYRLTGIDLSYHEPNTVEVPHIEQYEYESAPASSWDLNGTIKESDQTDTYYLTPELDGTYNINISEVLHGTYMSVNVYNHLGEVIASDSYFENGNNLELANIKSGEQYKIELSQKCGYGDYVLTVNCQKEPIDITQYNLIKDSVEFAYQNNIYYFTPDLEGIYTFTVSDMNFGAHLTISVFDRLGYPINQDSYYQEFDSLEISTMKAGELYTIVVSQNCNYTPYKLSIGKQKEPIKMDDYAVILDSIEYNGQINKYLFTACETGEVKVKLTDVNYNSHFEVQVLDKYMKPVYSETHFEESESFVFNAQKGETYEIQIIQTSYYSDYTLTIC